MLFSSLNLLFLCQVALGSSIHRRVAPLPPAQDPFYQPPAGYESAKPGTILASRPAPAKLAALQLFPLNIKSVTQLLYRTTNALGEPEVTVSTVMVPENADYSKVVSYQVAEDSGGQINCAPSYTLQTGSKALYAGTGDVEMLLILAALNEGWVVSSPDWEGPNSTFIEGFQAGQATLDSVRAVLSSGNLTGVESDAKVQMWGYSGGALASEWAMELQESYAPELTFVGAAIGGVTPNTPNVYNSINNGPFAGIAAAGLLGMTNAFEDFDTALTKQLIPATAAQFYQGGTNCFYGDVLTFANQNMSKYFYDGDNIIKEPTIAKYFRSNAQMGTHGVPQMPLFVYKAVADEISPIADTDALVNQFCNDGVSITYVRDAAGEHFTQAATSFPDVINFLRARFAGTPISGCSIRNEFLDVLDPGAPSLFTATVARELLNILGTPVGPTHF
ncbi:secretory lipase-like protein 1 precursor [Aureobasidium sp. EXF-10728]|nr:secretory lipase-like protein 1 precursor [Aureobasidium sp. EXF-10728]